MESKILFSICVPVRDDLPNLRQCLMGLKRQDLSSCEVIVCDDGSNPPIAPSQLDDLGLPFTLLQQKGQGPSVARNHMAQVARGEYLFFVDADTVAADDLVSTAREIVSEVPGIDAFYGSYDDEPAERSLVSWYRNLLHHHTHQTSASLGESVTTFWCGCGVVRRLPYLKVGGLSALYDKPSIEDIELGNRLTAHGIKVRVFPELQVKHLKHWTLGTWLYTDLYRRGVPWVRLMRATNSWESQLNFSWSQRLSSLSAVIFAAALPLLLIEPGAALATGAVSLAAFVFLNRGFVALARRKRGIAAAAMIVPLHLIYALVCVSSVCIGLASPKLKLPPTPQLTRPGDL